MDMLEKVEKLVEKTGVSYEEANRALIATDGDLLNAIIWLERQGKFGGQNNYEHVYGQEIPPERGQNGRSGSSGKNFGQALMKLLETLIKSDFHVKKDGADVFSVPVLVVLLCLIFATLPSVIVLAGGFFFGLRYSLAGVMSIGRDVKDVIARAADAAEDVKGSIERMRSEGK